MAKKPTEYKPFDGVTCQRIRNLIAKINATESAREDKFTERDKAREDLAKLADGGTSRKRTELEAAYGAAVLAIDQLNADVKYYRTELKTTVEKADEPGLWQSADIEEPIRGKPDEDEGEGEDKDQQTLYDQRPVGRPKKTAAPATAEGVDEHLKVAVNELDLPEKLKGRLVKAGLEQVADVALAIDKEDHNAFEAFGDPELGEIKKAVATYRQKHRKAAREAEAPLQFPRGQTAHA